MAHNTAKFEHRSRAVAVLIAIVVVGAAIAVILSMRAERERTPGPAGAKEPLVDVAPDELNVILKEEIEAFRIKYAFSNAVMFTKYSLSPFKDIAKKYL